ncbi:unnamed protein product, partial [Staurois parvus]
MDGATGLGPSGGAAGAGPPGWSDRSRTLRRERQVSGPQAGRRGAGSPGGAAGAGPPSGANQVSGPQAERAGTESPGTTVGSESNWYDRRHWVRHCMVWLDSGHRVTRHQVILARQRAPRHPARQWAPSQLV